MNLDDVKRIRIPRKKRQRVGRGPGSGLGKTSGRGHKGAGQRSGHRLRLRFEGGQMPLYRRLPKKGFSNARFRAHMHVVNVGDLDAVFEADAAVDLATLKRVGLAPKRAEFLKVLGFGELTKALRITAHGVSKGAQEKIDAAQGSIEILPTRTEMRPKGVKKGGAGAPGPEAAAAPDPAAGEATPPTADTPEADDAGGEA